MDEDSVDAIADTLDVKYAVIDNLKDGKLTYDARIILTNQCSVPLSSKDKWQIYFCHIRMVEPSMLPDPKEVAMDKYGIMFTHVNGCLFTIEPLENFKTLNKGDSLEIDFKAQYYSVARTDMMPNWYIVVEGLKPRLIKSTCGEHLNYVQSFDEPKQWKRFHYKIDLGMRSDKFDPFTPEDRLKKGKIDNLGKADKSIIPTPLNATVDYEQCMDMCEGKWLIIHSTELKNEAEYLRGKLCSLNIQTETATETGSEKDQRIVLTHGKGKVSAEELSTGSLEAYKLAIDPSKKHIEVTGNSPSGVFYGNQSLLALHDNGKVPKSSVIDSPRYPYRGMHLDISRNFHGKDQVLKLLDVMCMYKMNKFHFHLTDDEGWRLEIPGLEELTSVGSKRGHDLTEQSCILPMLGSGPNFDTSGTGHFSVEDYRDILRYATERHIEVIPEIDMPGHSHAAIKAMKVRYKKYENEDIIKAKEYLLCDLDHSKNFQSVQMFSENSMNPGLESTYTFVDKVVSEVKKMHMDIAPLRTLHFGGDEVPYEAWEGSQACQKLIEDKVVKSFNELMEYFVKRVAEIVANQDLCLGAWQDGVIHDEVTLKPVKRSKFPNKEVYVYAWQNVWESGLAGCAYKLANGGYKTVMTQGTHLYFDHPYEPDPEERGLYWAARYIDTHKTFGFMPDNLYRNADLKLTGDPISVHDLMKNKDDHVPLIKKENVVGVQGQLWTELVRTAEEMDNMIYPRLISLAERCWHKASWESDEDDTSRKNLEGADWTLFANSLGYKELPKLDQMGIAYHLTPPGARIVDGKLEMVSVYPGLPLYYSLDSGATWTEFKDKVDVDCNVPIQLLSKSADRKRSSRIVTLEPKSKQNTTDKELFM